MDRIKLVICAVLLTAGVAAAAWAVLSLASIVLVSGQQPESGTVMTMLAPGVFGLLVAGAALRPVRHAGDVVDDLPVISSLASVCGYVGVTSGALVGAALIDHLPVRIAAGVVAVLAGVMTVLRARSLRDEFVSTRAERKRITWLQAHGKRVRGVVVQVAFPGVWSGELALFQVGAEYTTREGMHRVDEQILAPLGDAPTEGGTVLLWTVPDGSDPQNVLMEIDGDSIRHPDPDQFLAALDTHHPDPLRRLRW